MEHIETLTTLIGKKAAEKLYSKAGENFMLLGDDELTYLVGQKAAKIVKAAIKMTGQRFTSPDSITCSNDIFELNADMRNLQYEEFRVIYLRQKRSVIKTSKEFTGGVAAVYVDARKIWANALLCNATAIALIHNHPSGIPTPSASDNQMTSIMVQQSKIMGIELLDHVIIGSMIGGLNDQYYSFADQGKI